MTDNKTEYISLQRAAELTDMSVKTLRRRIADGSLQAHRSGRLIRVRLGDLEQVFSSIPTIGQRGIR